MRGRIILAWAICLFFTGECAIAQDAEISPIGTTTDHVAPSNWYAYSDTNKIDDSISYRAALPSEESLGDGFRRDEKAILIIRCKDQKLELYVVWPDFLGSGDTDVRVRLDNNKPYRQTWSISTDGRGAFANRPKEFEKSLRTAKKVIIEVDPYGELPEAATFVLTGLSDVERGMNPKCFMK